MTPEVDQYLRRASLVLPTIDGDGLDFTEFKIHFKVTQRDFQSPNTLTARIFNVTRTTAERVGIGINLENVYKPVELSAGYVDGNFGRIFKGNLRQTRFGRINQTDTYFDVLAGDAAQAYESAVLNNVLAASTTTIDAQVAACAAALAQYGMDPQAVLADIQNRPLPRGKVMVGLARDVLREIAASHGLQWGISDGQLVMVPIDGTLPSQTSGTPATGYLINRQTGMIGLPEQALDGIHVKTLLNPNLKVYGRIQLDNSTIQDQPTNTAYENTDYQFFPPKDSDVNRPGQGIYRIMVAEHEGDTRGPAWYSSLICLARNGAQPPVLTTRFVG